MLSKTIRAELADSDASRNLLAVTSPETRKSRLVAIMVGAESSIVILVEVALSSIPAEWNPVAVPAVQSICSFATNPVQLS